MEYNKLPKGFKNWTQLYMAAMSSSKDCSKGISFNSAEENIYIYTDVLNKHLAKEYTDLLKTIESPRLEMGTIMTTLYNHYRDTGMKTKHDILTNLYELLVNEDTECRPSYSIDLETFKKLMNHE